MPCWASNCTHGFKLALEAEFKEREERADELSASVASTVQQMEVEHPKPRGRRPLRRESTISLGVDEDEAFSSAASTEC